LWVFTVDDQEITVMAFPAEATALDFVMPMLKEGKISEALPYLESLTKSAPANAAVLYNLGICYNELGQYDEAVIRLKRAVQLDPGHAHAWVGIGNAYYRMRKPEQALEAFEKAVELDPNDGYNRRNLGGVLIAFNRLDEALGHLRAALKLLPDDPQSIFGLATALESVGTDDADVEADDLYKRFILEHPTSPMVEQAEKSRTAFAHKSMKSRTAGGFRQDVMLYMLDALKTFKKIGAAKRREIAVEIAILGRTGLDINDYESKYKLKSLSGTFSGLHLLSIMYAAFKQIDPKMDTGVDFSAEYRAALDLSKK
jgi:tetratricopeptide (TPR) repeat protein